jgi:hypothetical protein
MTNKEIWTIKLDWLNIIDLLGLDTINQVSEIKKDKAIKKITKLYGTEDLMEAEHSFLDKIVANELKELMKKELGLKARQEEKRLRDLQSNFMPMKNGGIINIDPRDLKDLDLNGDPQEILKKLAKKFFRQDNDDDDDRDTKNEDSTGYYI